ncbi:MAG: dienelactone hydrolase family protein [Chloroflexota bacterium]
MSIKQSSSVDTAIFRYRSGYHEINALLAVPSVPTPMPAVLLAHDTDGLDERLQGVAISLAEQGYAVLAPDFYTTKNGHATASGSLENRATLRRNTPDAIAVSDLKNGLAYLKHQGLINTRRVAVVGFGFGGTLALLTAVQLGELAAVVNFYGHTIYPPADISRVRPTSPLDVVGVVRCPILSFYGTPGTGGISSHEVTSLEQTLKAKGKTFEIKSYPKAPNGFCGSNPDLYRADAASDALSRTVTFLNKYLKTESLALVQKGRI